MHVIMCMCIFLHILLYLCFFLSMYTYFSVCFLYVFIYMFCINILCISIFPHRITSTCKHDVKMITSY